MKEAIIALLLVVATLAPAYAQEQQRELEKGKSGQFLSLDSKSGELQWQSATTVLFKSLTSGEAKEVHGFCPISKQVETFLAMPFTIRNRDGEVDEERQLWICTHCQIGIYVRVAIIYNGKRWVLDEKESTGTLQVYE